MPLYTALPPAEGRRRLRKWRGTVYRAVGLLLATLLGCMVGLFVLDDSTAPMDVRLFRALWNAANTISMIGDLDPLNHAQELFMIGAMFTLMIVGGYAITVLTGVLAGDEVQAYREYRRVEKSLTELAGHHVVVLASA